MQRQDIPGVRTAQDLERKYKLEKLLNEIKGNVAAINDTKADLNNFIKSTLSTLKEFEADINEKVDIWYYNYKPSLTTEPSVNWNTDEEKRSHIGDLFYDRETGYCYTFTFNKENNIYEWLEIKDKDLKDALSTANAAKDAADNKRRVFLEEPYPPYDNGDLWINDGLLYACQISKTVDEEYEDGDFIDALSYTDDSLAQKVGDQLEVLKGQVLSIVEGVDQFKLNFEETIKRIDELQQSTIESVRNMTYTFGTREFTIVDSTDLVSLRMNNRGVKIYNRQKLQSIFNHNGTGVDKLIAVESIQLQSLKMKPIKMTSKHFEGEKDGVGFFNLKQLIQKLEDLEDDTLE